MISERPAALEDLSALPGNEKCIDCGASHATWASVSYEIFLCLNCAGEHRALGTHNSFVRSLDLDKWTDTQISLMRAGGNAKAAAFFQSADLLHLPIPRRYQARAAHEYAVRLCADAGQPVPVGFMEPDRCPEVVADVPKPPDADKTEPSGESPFAMCIKAAFDGLKWAAGKVANLVH